MATPWEWKRTLLMTSECAVSQPSLTPGARTCKNPGPQKQAASQGTHCGQIRTFQRPHRIWGPALEKLSRRMTRWSTSRAR